MDMYVLQVQPGYEGSAAERLVEMGYSAYCPKAEMILRSGGAWHTKEPYVAVY